MVFISSFIFWILFGFLTLIFMLKKQKSGKYDFYLGDSSDSSTRISLTFIILLFWPVVIIFWIIPTILFKNILK